MPLDAAVTVAAYLAAPELRRAFDPWLRPAFGAWSFRRVEYHFFLTLVVVVEVALLWALGSYRRDRRLRPAKTAWRVFAALAISHLLFPMFAFYTQADFLSRGVMLIFFALNYAGIMAVRLGVTAGLRGAACRNTLVIGVGAPARRLAKVLKREEAHRIVGFVDAGGEEVCVEADRVLGNVTETAAILERCRPVDEVALALPTARLGVATPAIEAAQERGVALRQMLVPPGEQPRKATFEHVGGLDMLTWAPSPASAAGLLAKRLMDLAGATVGLAAMAAVFPFAALAIKLSSRGPIFYGQKRVGLNGRVFVMYKFRSMRVGAHAMRNELAHLNEMRGPRFKIERDPRVTPAGRWLRRFSLDELPQFFNVLKGDMSLVGPRPFPIEEVDAYRRHHHRRLAMKPGLTGPWQTGGRCKIKDFDRMLTFDEDYITNWSLWLDVKILLKTVPAVLFGRGAM